MSFSRTNVSWIPAHPSYGAISMRRYWQALDENTKDTDRYEIHSVIRPWRDQAHSGIRGKALRLWQRRVGYPWEIHRRFNGEIAHILDHSWTDMLSSVPGTVPKVVTVHDLIPLRFPGELTFKQLGRFRSWISGLDAADSIIAVSEYTKREIIDLLGIQSEKIHVVFNGVDMLPWLESSSPVSIRDSFRIGSIGSTLERKNLEILPEALSRLKIMARRPVTLVRVGAPLPPTLASEIRDALGEKHLIELGRLPDDALQEFYSSIDALVVPSLYEGFGLPVIEGMAARIPVVSSNSTSLPEVGGDIPFYFDPRSPEELANVLVTVAREGATPSRLDAGCERARRLSWRTSLEGVYSVYDKLIEKTKISLGR